MKHLLVALFLLLAITSGCSRVPQSGSHSDPSSGSTGTPTGTPTPPPTGTPTGSLTLLSGASFQLLNNGASTTPSTFVTNMFGLPFKSCAMAAGQCIANVCTPGTQTLVAHPGAPAFALNGSTVGLLFSESTAPTCWPDGSLREASFLLTYSAASGIASGASVTVNIYAGGSYPSPSSRSTADFNPSSLAGGNCDLNTQVAPLDTTLGSGIWTADIWDAVQYNGVGSGRNAGADYVDVDGASGTVWRIRAQYKQSGTAQKQLEAWYYVQDLQTPSGAFYGFRELGRTTLPYYNNLSATPQNSMSFTTWYLCNGHVGSCTSGNGLLVDLWNGHETSVTMTLASSGSNSFTTSPSLVTNQYGGTLWEYGNLIRLSSVASGSSLATGTDYFVQNGSGGGDGPYNNTPILYSASNVVGPVSLGTCSSYPCNFTARSYPYLTPFGSLFDATSTANYNYEKCGGSGPSSDVNVQYLPNAKYWRSTGVIPSYSLSDRFPYQGTISGSPNAGQVVTATPVPTTTYWPMTAVHMDRAFEDTGERPDIGLFPGWDADYFNLVANNVASITNEVNMRAMGLAIGNWPINIRDIATVTLPTLNDGHNNSGSDYPGMVGVQVTGANGCSSSNCPQWSKVAYNPEGVGQNTGFAFPTNTKITLAGWNTFNTSHWPQPEFPAYLVTGEPQYRDLLLEQADTAIIQRNSPLNTSTINSTTVDWGGAPPGRNFVICSNPPTCSTTNSYYGVTLNSNNEIRKDAWAHAIAAEAAFVVSPESAGQSVHQYFNDIESQWASAYITFQNWEAAVNPWAGSVGLFNEATGELTPWTLYYFQGSVGYSYQLTLNSTEISVLNNLMLWPNYVDRITDPVSGARVGASFVAAYAYGVRPSPNDSTTQYQTSDKDGNGSWIVAPGNFGFTWSSSAGFTFTGSSGNWFGAGWSGYSPHAGDTVLFCGNYCGIGTAPPPNYSTMTPYFVNNVTATTFELAPYVAGSNGCNEQYQSGCVPLQYGSGSNTSNTAELYTSTIPFSLPACGTAPYSSGTCQSIATLIGEGGTGYNAIAYGNFMIGQAALNFYNCQVGSCTSGFSTGNSNNAQLYTDLQNMLQNDPVDFVSAYETIGGSKYATVPNP